MQRRPRRTICLAPVAFTIVTGCRSAPADMQPSARPEPPRTPASAPATASAPAASASSAAAPALAPLSAAAPLVSLDVPGFRAAVVSVPRGATEPRPVVVALHGNFDRPEWQCEVMKQITEGYPFILCPRGIPRSDVPKSWDRWEYGALKKTKEELFAGLAALEERFAGYVSEGPVVFTGFSLGAILGRGIVRDDPARFPRVLFTEGGSDGWNFQRFKQQGGERLLFGCAQAGCAQRCRAIAKQAARYDIQVRVADGGNVGHTYDGPVARAIRAEWNWLTEGDARWPTRGADAVPASPDAG